MAGLKTASERMVRFEGYSPQQHPVCYNRMAICKPLGSHLASFRDLG